MIGKPVFNRNDKVSFELENNKYTGYVYIVDKWGTFEDDSDVSYDIMVNNWGDTHDKECLFKHINQKYLLNTIDIKDLLECFIKKYQNNFLAYNEHKYNTIELLNKEHKVKNLSTDNIESNKSLLKEIVKTYCKELCIDDTKFIKYIDEY